MAHIHPAPMVNSINNYSIRQKHNKRPWRLRDFDIRPVHWVIQRRAPRVARQKETEPPVPSQHGSQAARPRPCVCDLDLRVKLEAGDAPEQDVEVDHQHEGAEHQQDYRAQADAGKVKVSKGEVTQHRTDDVHGPEEVPVRIVD